MAAVKHVGVREPRKELADNLQGNRPIVIERHGKVIGLYLPVQEIDREQVEHAFQDFQAALEEVMRQTGMTREELAKVFTSEQVEE